MIIFVMYYTKMITMSIIHTTLPMEHIFPLSTQEGSDCSGINQQKIRFLGSQRAALNQNDLQLIMERHHEFLASGGAGGQWKVLQINDITVGFYDLLEEVGGQQAIFERMNLSQLILEGHEFPFANFCGVFAQGLKAAGANLGHCLFTDSSLEGADFSGANLQHVDFSRSILKGVNFQRANLHRVDFENCDLRGTDFTGARFTTARFPGAYLTNVNF
jgi:uncharacterized protein YjbI with pentapeptide repeats